MHAVNGMRGVNNPTEFVDPALLPKDAYWHGMAMHRKYPRRVLMALRFLLIESPSRR